MRGASFVLLASFALCVLFAPGAIAAEGVPTEMDPVKAARAGQACREASLPRLPEPDDCRFERRARERLAQPDSRADRRRQDRRRDPCLHGAALRRLRAVPAALQADDGAPVEPAPRCLSSAARSSSRAICAADRLARRRCPTTSGCAPERLLEGDARETTRNEPLRRHRRRDGGRRPRVDPRAAAARYDRRRVSPAKRRMSRCCATSCVSSKPIFAMARYRASTTSSPARISNGGRSRNRRTPTRTVASMPSRAGALTAAIVAGALPIAAMLIYVALGNFEAFSGGATAGRHDVSPEQIAKMIKELEGAPREGSRERRRLEHPRAYLLPAQPLSRGNARVRACDCASSRRRAAARRLRRCPRCRAGRNAARQAARTRHAGACRRSDAVESTRPCRHRSIRSQGLRAGGGLLGAHEGIGASRLADRSINRCKHRGSARTGRPEGNDSRNGGGDAGASRHGKGAGRSGSVDSSEGARCQRVSRCRGRDGDARARACGEGVAQ